MVSTIVETYPSNSSGSGSTGLAARAESVRCILIEREPEYLNIIRQRLSQLSLLSELLDTE